jgi:RNA polymerase sigma factor (sigma-70 family)
MDEFLTRLRRALHLPDGTEPTDAQLLARYVEHREEAAFAALVQRHGQMVFGVCRRALAGPDAEDAFQATFFVLARRAASVSPREQLGAWLHGVARRTALKARERAHRRFARERTVSELPDVGAPEPPREEALAVIDEELERLPSKYRVPVVLCDVEGLTREEAARRLGWVVGTLSWRLSAARKLLADRLTRRGVGLSAVALASAAGAPPALAGSHAPEVTALAEEVLSAMTTTKLRLFAGALCVALLAGISAAVFAMPPDAPPVPKADAPVQEARGAPKLRATLKHATGVHALAYSADGKRLAAAGDDDFFGPDETGRIPVRIWDTATNKELRTLNHTEGDVVFLLRFAPDGKLFVGGLNPALWDADTGKLLVQIKGHRNEVGTAAFAPDGKTLATGGADGSSRVWDTATGKQLAQIPFGTNCIAYAPDGKALALVDTLRRIKLWDVATNKERASLEPPSASVEDVALSPDGKRLAHTEHIWGPPGDVANGESAIRVLDFNGKELLRIRGKRMEMSRAVQFSPDGALLVSTGIAGSVRLWDAHTGERLAVVTERHSYTVAVAFSPDGNTLAVSSRNEVHLWDVSALRKKK